ncbi:MAG: hypothetical protein WCR78_03355 [Arcobacteraceae bacterium]
MNAHRYSRLATGSIIVFVSNLTRMLNSLSSLNSRDMSNLSLYSVHFSIFSGAI